MITELSVADIDSSPFQSRKYFSKAALSELGASIQRDGLIEPIVVRQKGGRYELIAGERRWRATRDVAQAEAVLARIVEADDIQARRMCAAENMQREDLSAVEEVEAIVELADAELIEHEEYLAMGDSPIRRVRATLGALDDVRRSEERGSTVNEVSKEVSCKFIGQIGAIFSHLPRKKEWRSFLSNDLPLACFDTDVRSMATANRLNKSQTKSLAKLKAQSKRRFNKLAKTAGEDGIVDATALGAESNDLRELSAGKIEALASGGGAHVSNNSGVNEWYTPAEFIDAATSVMGSIDLDPATSVLAQKTVQAATFYTEQDDGLTQDWSGTTWMNPPYAASLIDKFMGKLHESYSDGSVTQAITLTNNSTETAWFQAAAAVASAICFPAKRVKFLDVNGEPKGAPLQGQACLYFGDETDSFIEVFSKFGITGRL